MSPKTFDFTYYITVTLQDICRDILTILQPRDHQWHRGACVFQITVFLMIQTIVYTVYHYGASRVKSYNTIFILQKSYILWNNLNNKIMTIKRLFSIIQVIVPQNL